VSRRVKLKTTLRPFDGTLCELMKVNAEALVKVPAFLSTSKLPAYLARE
jgi:hypothetical protein